MLFSDLMFSHSEFRFCRVIAAFCVEDDSEAANRHRTATFSSRSKHGLVSAVEHLPDGRVASVGNACDKPTPLQLTDNTIRRRLLDGQKVYQPVGGR